MVIYEGQTEQDQSMITFSDVGKVVRKNGTIILVETEQRTCVHAINLATKIYSTDVSAPNGVIMWFQHVSISIFLLKMQSLEKSNSLLELFSKHSQNAFLALEICRMDFFGVMMLVRRLFR